MIIEIYQFPTHIAKTNNKVAPNKMIKINNQAIYNSNLNRFARNIVMSNLHAYLEKELKHYSYAWARETKVYPIKVKLTICVPRNYNTVRLIKGKVRWKPPKPSYSPNWDIENLGTIWMKAINDTFTKLGYIPDDNVEYINEVVYKYEEVEDLKDRKLIIEIDEY